MLLQRPLLPFVRSSFLQKYRVCAEYRFAVRRTMSTVTDGRDAKKALRTQMKGDLALLSDQDINSQSEKAQDLILKLPQYQHAQRVGIYLSMPKGEAQTAKLVKSALGDGKAVFVPCVYPIGDAKPKKKVMDMLRLESLEDYERLERDAWGIPSLPKPGRESRENAMGGSGPSLTCEGTEEESSDIAGLDLIVVPAVAFDRHMNRMGHGAGFYDHYLSRFCSERKRAKPFLVGLCLAQQVVALGQLVMEEWDWTVDAVAVGDGTLLTSRDTQ